MKASRLIAGMLAAGVIAHASEPKAADVMIYVSGSDGPPAFVDFPARNTVTRMFNRIGVRLAWEDDLR